jgi:RNA polymerase sigma-70 factor (ECF subfamily)
MPHLDAAYNLARWLTRNEHDAQDIVQEACLRAFRFLDGFRGGNSRAWLLSIVRNTTYTWLQQNRKADLVSSSEEDEHMVEDPAPIPDLVLLRGDEQQALMQAVEELPPEFREVIVLRELEELSYKEIAGIVQVPIGTVMSRLARARQQLERRLSRSIQLESVR